ncbi:F-box and WD-40 domain protein 7 [Paragonimus westermani]|uniref:F-box and WD-40 domain protein 7 n=1 Tax=Paragonimus westermani TaxID=34504 RepID=A0A5J4P112_9TREM|nr:F-box and WD-40 domain protein 7 [Paragonimus westermani]
MILNHSRFLFLHSPPQLNHSIPVSSPSLSVLTNIADSLIACSLVNRAWFHAARNPQLYRRLCQLPEWCSPIFDKRLLVLCDRTEQSMCSSGLNPRRYHSDVCCAHSDCSLSSGLRDRQQQQVDWFTIFKKRSRLRHNWLLGKCRIRQFTGHSEAVYCVAYDTYRIASGSADATIRVWNVRTNANWSVQTLRGHSAAVRCLQLLPLVSPVEPSTQSSQITAESQFSIGGNPTDVWQPPEAILISGSTDTTIKLWRLSTTMKWSRITCTSTLQGHTDTVRCLQVGSLLLLPHPSRLHPLNCRGHAAGVVCLTYDEHLLYSGSLDNTVRVWCLSSGACLYNLYRASPSPTTQSWLTPVSSLHLDLPRNRLLIAHHDGVILIWTLPTPTQLANAYLHALHTDPQLPWHPILVPLTVGFGESEVPSGTVVRCIGGDSWHIVCGSDNKTLMVSLLVFSR